MDVQAGRENPIKQFVYQEVEEVGIENYEVLKKLALVENSEDHQLSPSIFRIEGQRRSPWKKATIN